MVSKWNQGDIVLDLYEVQESYTGGGMGVVYKVYHRNWHMLLAVKSPKSEFFESQVQKDNFIRECETWINLGLHPNIVSCYYVREIDGIPRVFCEFIEGGSLKDWIADKQLYEGSQEEVLARMLDIAIQFAWGLQYAHEANLVHQDVKPANVMMREDGTPLVTDFGLAKAKGISGQSIRSDNQQSISVTSGGYTPAYCSPEQFSEQPVTRKTDIWSWAVSILEMFTGEIIWQGGQLAGGSLDVAIKEGNQHPDIPAIPPELGTLLQKCLQYKAEDRPIGMQEISEELQRIYQSITGKAYPRKYPQAAEIDAGSLNNRAISYLDLGKEAEAEKLFQEALAKHPGHLDTTYNYGIWKWRKGLIDDILVLKDLDACGESLSEPGKKDFYKAQIHLGRLDTESAMKCLKNAIKRDYDNLACDEQLRKADFLDDKNITLICSLIGHTGDIKSACISPDMKTIISASLDKTIKIWDIDSGKCLETLKEHSSGVTSLSISIDGTHLISGSWDHTLKEWDLQSRKCIQTLIGHSKEISSVCYSPDCNRVLSGSNDYTLILWDLQTGKPIHVYRGHPYDISDAKYSYDGKWGLSGCCNEYVMLWDADTTMKLWDINSGLCYRTFEGHTRSVTSVLFMPDNKHALSGSRDGTVKKWNIDTGACVCTYYGNAGCINSINISSDGRWILSGHDTGILKIWDESNGVCLRTINDENIGFNSISIDKDNNILVTVRGDKIYVHSINGFFENFTMPKVIPLLMSHISTTLQSIMNTDKYNAICKDIQSVSDVTNNETIWNLVISAQSIPNYERNSLIRSFLKRVSAKFQLCELRSAWLSNSIDTQSGCIFSLCYSPDGKYVLSGHIAVSLSLWDTSSGKEVRSYDSKIVGTDEHYFMYAHINTACISADGIWGLSCFGSSGLRNLNGETVKLWDLRKGICLRTFNGHTKEVTSVCFSSDLLSVLSGSLDRTLRIWDIKSGKCQRKTKIKAGIVTMCLKPHSRNVLIAYDDSTIDNVDIDKGKCIISYKGHSDIVNTISIDSKGKLLLSGSKDSSIRLWDIDSGRCLLIMNGHKGSVTAVKFSPNSKFAVSGSQDHTIAVWDLSSGNCINTLDGHMGGVNSIDFTPDGWQIASGSSDNTIKLWDLDWTMGVIEQNNVEIKSETPNNSKWINRIFNRK